MKPIQSVERAFKLLEILDNENHAALGVLELSRITGLKQPTVHNFLQTLLHLGYVRQDGESSKYMLAANTRYLGWNGGAKKKLAEVARPAAQLLYDRFNETVVVAVASGNIRMGLFHINSSRALSVRSDTSMDSKFYSSSTGRCMLSKMSDSEMKKLLRVNGLPSNNEWPEAGTWPQLEAALEKIRDDGYAVYRNEGIVAVGTPVFVPEAKINAALGMFLPETRFQKEYATEIIKAIVEAAVAIVREFKNV